MKKDQIQLNKDSLLREGNTVHLVYQSKNDSLPLRASIQKLNDEYLQLQILKNNPPMTTFKKGDLVLLLFLNDNEIYKYIAHSTVLEVDHHNSIIKIIKPEDLEVGLRRRSYRCEVNLPFSFYCCHVQYNGRVFNLSETGLWAAVTESPTKLDSGEILLGGISLPSENNRVILFDGKVIRYQQPYHNFSMGLALTFEKIKPEEQKLIVKYIYQRQREILKEFKE